MEGKISHPNSGIHMYSWGEKVTQEDLGMEGKNIQFLKEEMTFKALNSYRGGRRRRSFIVMDIEIFL
jgi:hypothetical protein